MKNYIAEYRKLPKNKKIQLSFAVLLSAAIIVSFPVYAWFSNQRQVATVARINSPAKLSIKSGKAEDIAQFKLAGINVGDDKTSGSKDYVFCVEGEDNFNYAIQIAHTTNIDFTYKLYRAHTGIYNGGYGIALYTDLNGDEISYTKAEEVLGGYINLTTDTLSARKIGTDSYSEKSYDTGDSRQMFAEPLYWQSDSAQPLYAKEYDNSISPSVSFDEYSSIYNISAENKFLNFYVLEVSWEAKLTNDKETDLIYITAQVV